MRASGRTNGVVLDSGYGLTSAVPIYENKVLKDSVNKLDFAGDDLTLYMQKLLGEKRLDPTIFKEKDIKEKLGYVASNFEEELKRAASLEKSYEPPDGDKITVGAEQFKCPEALFQPSLANVEGNGIHEMIFNSVQKSERDVQKELFSNIVLSGGSTLFPGLENRLEKELVKKTSSNFDIKIFAPKYRKYSAWIGGAQLASLPEFESMCISRSEYSESGPSILARFD